MDDSFINYCNKAGALDIICWENYLFKYPGEKETIEEAKAFVCGLKILLRKEEKGKALQNFIELLEAKKKISYTGSCAKQPIY